MTRPNEMRYRSMVDLQIWQEPFSAGLICRHLLQMPSLPLAAFPPSPEPQEGGPQGCSSCKLATATSDCGPDL